MSNLNKIKHIQISDKDDNDIKILLNDILISLNNIEISYEYNFNFLLLGDSMVGKTNLIYRIVDNKYIEYCSGTLGPDGKTKKLNMITGKTLNLKFYDFGGQERFRSLALSYAKYSDCSFLIYDKTDIKTFYDLKELYKELVKYANIKLIYIIENKIDIIDEGQVNEEEVIEFAIENNLRFFKISCKENIGIKELLIDIFYEITKIGIEGKRKDLTKKQYKKKKINN